MEEKSEKEIEEGWFVRQEKESQENVDSQGKKSVSRREWSRMSNLLRASLRGGKGRAYWAEIYYIFGNNDGLLMGDRSHTPAG